MSRFLVLTTDSQPKFLTAVITCIEGENMFDFLCSSLYLFYEMKFQGLPSVCRNLANSVISTSHFVSSYTCHSSLSHLQCENNCMFKIEIVAHILALK